MERAELRPGQTLIGFMTADGRLVGSWAKPSLGHERLAAVLNLKRSSGLKLGVVAITVGKRSDGGVQAFGSGSYGPLTEAARELA